MSTVKSNPGGTCQVLLCAGAFCAVLFGITSPLLAAPVTINIVDVAATRALHRLQLARELRRRRLGEADLGDHVRMLLLVGLDRILRQCEVAGDIDDVDGDRRGQKRTRDAKQRCAKGACA